MNIFKKHEISGGSSFAAVTVEGESRSAEHEESDSLEEFDFLPTANNLHRPSWKMYGRNLIIIFSLARREHLCML